MAARTALPSCTAIAGAIGGDGNRLADNDRRYRNALKHNPAHGRRSRSPRARHRALASTRAHTTQPPAQPAYARHRDHDQSARSRRARVSHGDATAQLTSTALCRNHTDLTCPEIASIHNVKDAESAFAHATVARYLGTDPDYKHRHRRLLREAQRLRREAGYENAILRRGLTSQSAATDNTQTLTGN